MFYSLLLLSIVYFAEPLPVLSEAEAKLPQGATTNEMAYVFEDDNMAFNISYLSFAELQQAMLDLGAPKALLEKQEMQLKLSQTVAFLVHCRNLGQEPMTFNPDQITFNERKSGPCGTMLDMVDFWPPALVYSEADRLNFARAFNRGTQTIQPGRELKQLVVFRRILGLKFPKRVELRLERIYYGIESVQLACGYRVRYPK